VSDRRSKQTRESDAPITGVAAGGLGTAANLDDTQVMKTADLEAAAPAWLASELPQAGQEPAAPPPADIQPEQAAPPPADLEPEPAPTMAVSPALPARRSQTRSRNGVLSGRSRSLPALAGVVAVIMLLVVAGAGFFSQLDLGNAANLPAGASAAAPTATGVAATQAPKAPKDRGGGHGGCRGHGHGNDCGGGD
jgi:hypothetical protein